MLPEQWIARRTLAIIAGTACAIAVPVDGVSADTTYAEQYTAWHLANAPRISAAVTLTTIADVKF